MFKLGIVRADRLDRPRTWLGARRFASLMLLRDLRAGGASDPRHYNGLLRMLRMANGTWKDTFHGRFGTLDPVTLEVLRESRPPASPIRVTDLGVSSGVTSVELYAALRPHFALDFVATDLWRDAFAVHGGRPAWIVVLDGEGNDLQYVLGRFVLPAQERERALYPVNRALLWLARRTALPRARALVDVTDLSDLRDFETRRVDGFEVTRLPLLSAECLDLLSSRSDFRFLVADLMEPLRRRADVIRAMNIITPLHFTEPELRRAIRNILPDLEPGGLLVLGRSPSDEPAAIAATVYREEAGVLRAARRLNGGAEVERLVEEEWGRLRAAEGRR